MRISCIMPTLARCLCCGHLNRSADAKTWSTIRNSIIVVIWNFVPFTAIYDTRQKTIDFRVCVLHILYCISPNRVANFLDPNLMEFKCRASHTQKNCYITITVQYIATNLPVEHLSNFHKIQNRLLVEETQYITVD